MEFKKAGYEVGIPKQDEPWVMHDCGIVECTRDMKMKEISFYDIMVRIISGKSFIFERKWKGRAVENE